MKYSINFSEAILQEYRNVIKTQILKAAERFDFEEIDIFVDEIGHEFIKQPSIKIKEAKNGRLAASLFDIGNEPDWVIGHELGHGKLIETHPNFSKMLDVSFGNYLLKAVSKIEELSYDSKRISKRVLYGSSIFGGIIYGAIVHPIYFAIAAPALYDISSFIIREKCVDKLARNAGYIDVHSFF